MTNLLNEGDKLLKSMSQIPRIGYPNPEDSQFNSLA